MPWKATIVFHGSMYVCGDFGCMCVCVCLVQWKTFDFWYVGFNGERRGKGFSPLLDERSLSEFREEHTRVNLM